jgi:hypothetical protein
MPERERLSVDDTLAASRAVRSRERGVARRTPLCRGRRSVEVHLHLRADLTPKSAALVLTVDTTFARREAFFLRIAFSVSLVQE